MNEEAILDIWAMFSDYVDKKQHANAASRYIDLLADLDVDINVLKSTLGNYEELDTAIEYFLDNEDIDQDF